MHDAASPPLSSSPNPAGTLAPTNAVPGAHPRRLGPWGRELILVFVLGVALLRWTYGLAEGVPGNDSFYHVKMAAMLPEHGLMKKFPWLRFVYFTDQGDDFVSHHYGFHVLLAPFVIASNAITGDELEGAKWAMSFFFGLNLALFMAVLRVCGVRGRWLWLILFLLMPHHFFTRHAFVRAIAPSLSCLLLIVLAIFRRRPVWLAILVAVYIHIYLGGLLYAPLLVGAYVAACFLSATGGYSVVAITVESGRGEVSLTEGVNVARNGESRTEVQGGAPSSMTGLWKLILAAAIGCTVGALSHPYSHGIVEFLRLQVFGTGLSPDISVGREWQPYSDVWWFTQISGFTLGAWLVAIIFRLRHGRPLDARELTLLLVQAALLILTLKARRFVEYWPVFCLLSAGALAAPILRPIADGIERRFSHGSANRRWTGNRLIRGGPALCVVCILLIVIFTPQWKDIRRANKCEFDLPSIRGAMAYLREKSQSGDVVFTDDWDIFPVFFYYNSHNHYIVGLDPKFTHHRDPVLWERYVKISRGQVPADVSVNSSEAGGQPETVKTHIQLEDIREHFTARFVVTDRDHKLLASKLSKEGDFAQLVYPPAEDGASADPPYVIFCIREP